MCLLISMQRIPEQYSIPAALHHYIVKTHRLFVGARMLRRLRTCCDNPRKAQEDVLLQIINRNKNTEYGRLFRLGDIKSLEDLRTKHPVTDYSRYKTFADRIARGEKNVLTTEQVTRLTLTSGTTGEGKMFPQDRYYLEKMMMFVEAIQHEMFPELQPMQSKLKIHCNIQDVKSECGLPITAASAVEDLMLRHMVIYSTPPAGFMIWTSKEAMYVHLLFALRDKNLGSIYTNFSSLFLDTIKYLETNWKTLVEDLARGTLNPALELSSDVRNSLSKALGSGDPQRAMEVQRECQKGFDGIVKRLWPHMNFIAAIDNVGLRHILQRSIAKGVEMYSPMYACSEALLGLNLFPFGKGEEEYVLNVAENVFEFIPEDDMDKSNPQTLFVDEVEVGQNYELLVTQKYGLCRYKFGDVIRVSGFYKNCPMIKFLYRKATLLNLVGEKVTQPMIQNSLKTVLNKWADTVELSHYSVAESVLLYDFFNKDKETKTTDLYYVFFLELKPKKDESLPKDLKQEKLAEKIDEDILKYFDEAYRLSLRTQIFPSTVYFVKPGAFSKLQEFLLANTTASRAQFKMPLKLRTPKMAEILLENIHQ
ncbi:Indole-3-acetic acid-amido synthetase GH3.17 [Holothuria leucospilota]|uniref:Indole-3-acetic acid-amido synthetase GH3.17 n=1 Tax=Holothuria leucospilota TaxID=206669 RepID=A0A9Q1C4M8_HOLLE|nr:Indole-3-acetic acid-amido synthetase GH3.17 [Holothuria leucospilota]